MSPDQQEPNQSQPASSSMPGQEGPQPYTSVPEFLHMEPVVDPQPKSHKLKLLLLIIMAVLVVTGVSVAAFVLFQGASERAFYQALDNLMATSYLDRKFSVASDNKIILTADAKSDCSIPVHCKSSTKYTINTDIAGQLSAEDVVTSNDGYALRFTAAPKSFLSSGFMLNQWQQLKNGGVHEALFVSSYRGFLLNGKLDPDIKSHLIQYMRTNNIYTIKSTNDDTVNGTKSTLFVVETNLAKLEALNVNAAKLLNDTSIIPFKNGEVTQMKVWVEAATNKIVKMSITQKSNHTYVTEINLNYPSSVSIDDPLATKA